MTTPAVGEVGDPGGATATATATATTLQAGVTANLAAERALLEQHARVVAASEGSNADDEHDPEGSTIAFERQQVAALLRQVRATGEQLQASLAALADGTYGTCLSCGRAIDPERLAARPQARTCIECARRAAARR